VLVPGGSLTVRFEAESDECFGHVAKDSWLGPHVENDVTIVGGAVGDGLSFEAPETHHLASYKTPVAGNDFG
jgi:hypothetical protein